MIFTHDALKHSCPFFGLLTALYMLVQFHPELVNHHFQINTYMPMLPTTLLVPWSPTSLLLIIAAVADSVSAAMVGRHIMCKCIT